MCVRPAHTAPPMKITIVNHSDNRGGAALVSLRLMEALRAAGHDAVMLVAHKYTDHPHVHAIEARYRLKACFAAEHLQILAGNGYGAATCLRFLPRPSGFRLAATPCARRRCRDAQLGKPGHAVARRNCAHSRRTAHRVDYARHVVPHRRVPPRRAHARATPAPRLRMLPGTEQHPQPRLYREAPGAAR